MLKIKRLDTCPVVYNFNSGKIRNKVDSERRSSPYKKECDFKVLRRRLLQKKKTSLEIQIGKKEVEGFWKSSNP
jgi:hypothetical protein